MSNSVQPHRRQPTRLPRPWDSPGKNTGVGCHFLLQCMKVKSESEVAQSCPTLSNPMDWSLPGSSIHGIFQARVLEWGAIAFSNKQSMHQLRYHVQLQIHVWWEILYEATFVRVDYFFRSTFSRPLLFARIKFLSFSVSKRNLPRKSQRIAAFL